MPSYSFNPARCSEVPVRSNRSARLLFPDSALLGLVKVACFFYSGVLGLWLGICSPVEPLVPTRVKSPSSVSGRIEAVKRGLHSSINESTSSPLVLHML